MKFGVFLSIKKIILQLTIELIVKTARKDPEVLFSSCSECFSEICYELYSLYKFLEAVQ